VDRNIRALPVDEDERGIRMHVAPVLKPCLTADHAINTNLHTLVIIERRLLQRRLPDA